MAAGMVMMGSPSSCRLRIAQCQHQHLMVCFSRQHACKPAHVALDWGS